MNPPYGRRLFTDVPTFYKMVGNVLKQKFQGCEAWIISSDDPNATFSYTDPRNGFRKEGTPFDFVGLKPSIKIDLNNGGIPCQLRKYELFSGKYEEFRKEGGELDKTSADQKQDNSKFENIRSKKPSRFSSDKPSRFGDKKFDKKDDGEGKKRFYDKDGKAFERGHKRIDDKPRRTRTASTERAYAVGKDGSIVAKSKSAEKDFTKKPFEKKPYKKSGDKPFEKKEGDKAFTPRGNFKRNAEGKLEEREGSFQPRGKREYDPNRPMFHKDFDMSKAVLDYTQDDTKKD